MPTTTIRNVRPPTTAILSVSGAVRFAVVDFTFDSSYATGGELMDFADTQLSGRTILGVWPPSSQGGYNFEYDFAAKKLKAFHFNYPGASAAAAVEVPAATNLSAITIRCLVATL